MMQSSVDMSFLNGTPTTLGYGAMEENINASSRQYWDTAQTAIFGTWLSISMLSAIFGNLMVIAVVIRHRGMRTRTNMFLVNLAVADFLVGCLMAPFSLATLIQEQWVFGDTMCTINGLLNAVCFVTSVHTLMYISIHKYLSIMRPLSSRHLNRNRILLMIAASWIWATICGILTVTGLSTVLYKGGTMQCGPEYPHNIGEYIHHVIIQLTNIFIPLGIMIFTYSKMFREIREHTIRLHENSTLERDSIIAQQKKATMTLFMVLLCFIICWIPYHIYSMYVTLEKDKESIPGFANSLAYCFGYMNSACNPIIYAWRSPAFREGYKQILCQQPSFVVSDDTVQENSPSAFRRLSTFLRGHISWRESDENSVGSMHRSRSSISSSPLPIAHFMKKSLSKTAMGSSVIRRDGSLVITKNGKIVSVRHDGAITRNKDENVYYPKTYDKSPRQSQTSEEMKQNGKNSMEVEPLLENGLTTRCDSIPEDNPILLEVLKSKTETLSGHQNEALLEISDTELNSPETVKESIVEDDIHICIKTDSCENSDNPVNLETFFFGETTTEKDLQQNCILNLQPLTPNTKERLTRSDIFLDSSPTEEAKSVTPVFKVPLLRCPSTEHLDIPTGIHRSVSDCNIRVNANMPQNTRRWTFSKDSRPQIKQKKSNNL